MSSMPPIEVVLASRSIGGNSGSPPSSQHHAGLIVNCGAAGTNEHWIVQGGPSNGKLIGSAVKATSGGWYSDFSKAKGAYWDQPNTVRILPVTTILTLSMPRGEVTGAYLQSLATDLNRTLTTRTYNYDAGPNSNSYVKLYMNRLSLPTTLPPNAPQLQAWLWT